ncbi:MAG: hypothetical protein NTZ13_04595 [Candidatus Parcubacteria bacterium]|nr:hypothetical protein [Candidatus Parcubacteria bacterium]
MNNKKTSSRQRTYYYVQPADQKTNNLIRTALPKKTITRSCEEAVGSPVRSTHSLYRVEWKDVEVFMGITYASFNVFVRKREETLPRFAMRKSLEITKRNLEAKRPEKATLTLVKDTKPMFKKTKVVSLPSEKQKKTFPQNPELARKNAERLTRIPRLKKAKLFLLPKIRLRLTTKKESTEVKVDWKTYAVSPQKSGSEEFTIRHIRKALSDFGFNTQSVREGGKLSDENFEQVWEMNGDALFRLWQYARKNPLIHFTVFRTSGKNGFEKFFSYPKEKMENFESKVLQFTEK